MDIEIDGNDKQVLLLMEGWILDVINMINKELKQNVNYSVYKKDLFVIFDSKSNKLDKARSDLFCNVVAKLLFTTKRVHVIANNKSIQEQSNRLVQN